MSTCDYQKPKPARDEALDLPDGIPPLRAFYLYLATSCNLSCRHCWITPRLVNGTPDPGETIDVNALQKAITEALPMGLHTLKLTGGEPLLHPDFRQICDLATAKDLSTNMETNCTLVTADLARYLKDETTMENISVSIDGSTPGSHDAFRGVPGAFHDTLRGLDHLVSAGYDTIQVIMAVHRGNLDDIENVARLAATNGAASFKLNPVVACGRGADMTRRGETMAFRERLALDRYVYRELKPALRAAGIDIDLILPTPPALMPISEIIRRRGDTGDCGVLGIIGFLGSGEIALCGIGHRIPELVYGRLGRDSIRSIWLDHPTIIQLRRMLEDVESYPSVCRKCTMARNCRTGCVAQNFVNGNQLLWPDSLCREAYEKGMFPATRLKGRPPGSAGDTGTTYEQAALL